MGYVDCPAAYLHHMPRPAPPHPPSLPPPTTGPPLCRAVPRPLTPPPSPPPPCRALPRCLTPPPPPPFRAVLCHAALWFKEGQVKWEQTMTPWIKEEGRE